MAAPVSETRIVRVPLPVDLIRQIDELILAGPGGFESRAELIVDAIRERIVELKFDEADPLPTRVEPEAVRSSEKPHDEQPRCVEASWTMTVLHAPAPTVPTLELGDIEVPDVPLFGLHNRDYPTLWAATQLAEIGPAPFEQAMAAMTERAWFMGDIFRALGEQTQTKLASLFPANREKKQAAEGRFESFAVGSARRENGKVVAEGPLFAWGLAVTELRDGDLYVGLSAVGRRLLGDLEGLDAREPHADRYARLFVNHLREFAPADWSVLREVLWLIDSEDTGRLQLIAHLRDRYPEWSENEGSTNAAGYVARGREWGLLAPRQERGLYRITDLGRGMIEENGDVQ